jgi:hypothetical protein
MPVKQESLVRGALAVALLSALAPSARADAITDWNVKSGEVVAAAKLGTPPAVRVMAIVQTAAYEAAKATARGPAMEAAIAAAHHVTLSKLIASQQPMIDAAYQTALAGIADGPEKLAGIATGQLAAATVLEARAADTIAPEAYRPHTTAGTYVTTAAAAVPQWGARKPWLMTTSAQFRPAPPPALESAAWARAYNEVKSLGGKTSAARTPEQAEIARFWEFSLPSIYHGVARSVADMPRRDTVRNARLFAAVAQAMDDALIGVFEAKYHYNFWRPATAIRNGDIDGNDATEREASWTPLIDAPMHPEYPSAHSTLAGAVGAVLEAETARGPAVVFMTASPTANGAVRRWSHVADFVNEVGDARIYAGIHYRSAVEAGNAMGRQVGELAVKRMGIGTGTSSLSASR